MSLSDELKQVAQKLASDPRIVKVLQSEQTLRLLTLLVEMPDRFGALSVSQGARFAKNFHLATREEVERLERRVADLEAQLAQWQIRAGQ
jgi:polyhydroxyalkanoate synthesis regulator phasin